MTMLRPRAFISISPPESRDAYAPQTHIPALQDALRGMARLAQMNDCRLIVRDHPAVADLMMDALGCPSPHLLLVPGDATAAQVTYDHTPAVAFFMGGGDGIMRDYAFFCRCPDVRCIPISATGQTAGAIDKIQRDTGHAPPMIWDTQGDALGFDRIASAMNYLQRCTIRRGPGGPQP